MDGDSAPDPGVSGTAAIVSKAPRHAERTPVPCAYMLCREQATALVLFDSRVATAWLVDVAGRDTHGLSMCTPHAERFRAPLGWVVSDERSPPDIAPPAAPESIVPVPVEPVEDAPPPTPLLARAFRTTAQTLI